MKRILLALALAGAFVVPAAAQTVNGYGNFSPHLDGGQAIAATTTSTSVTFSAPIGVNNTELYIFNAGTTIAFARWGVGAQTATSTGTGSIALPPGSVQVFNKQHADTVAVITSSGTGTIYVMSGQGR